MMVQKKKVYLLYLFAFLGVLVAGYMWYEYSQPEAITCQLGGCQTVRDSVYSSFLGIDVPVFGFVFYLGMALYAMSLLSKRKRSRLERAAFLLAATGALAFSIYLTYLELFVIHAICQWCVASAILSVGLYFTAYWIDNPLDLIGRGR